MKKSICLFFLLFSVVCNAQNKPVNLIFDTDMAPDYDDVGALAMLHAMADSNEVTILATVASNKCETAVPCIEVINTYFGRPDIPLGAAKGDAPDRSTWHKGLRWTDELPARYPHRVKSTSASDDAVEVYRKVLSEMPDGSVTIVTVGFFTNLRNLLLSQPDKISPLTGRELIKAKVKQLVSMAGKFPEGIEFNVEVDARSSQLVFQEWPTPIILSGFEIGEQILTGKRLAASGIKGSPIIDTFSMCLPQDDPKGRNSWDETAVLVAVRGIRDYFDIERGTITVLDNGSNIWEKNEKGMHSRLLFKMPKDQLTKVIEDMMMHKPETVPLVRNYRNPVVNSSLPDPSVIMAKDGYFYLYATEDTRNLPIHRSKDLINWEFSGTAFTDETRPSFEPKGGIWAPDINYFNGQYIMFYSMSVWGGEWTCGIGAATAQKPEGPFTDRGMLFRSNTIGVQNSIDPFYIEDNGKKYLFWGSFRGIYGIELADDGLSIKADAFKKQVAGTAYEGTYIHKHKGYYYLFASVGSCCEGLNSTYTTVVGRSESLWGPYVDKKGLLMLENHHEIVIHKNNAFVGTGHNSEIVTDRSGDDWIFYHAVNVTDPSGRVLLLDKVNWIDGWPSITGSSPSLEAANPVF